MKKLSALVATMLFCLLSFTLLAAEKDAATCKDHPLSFRMPGYYINDCNESVANADLDIADGKPNETVHVEGKSFGLSYRPQSDLASKPGEQALRGAFADAMKKQGGVYLGSTYSKWPVYKLNRDGKDCWVVLMVLPGEYYDGTYTCRVVEKGSAPKAAPKPVKQIDCRDYEIRYPLTTKMPGYQICGCGGFDAPPVHEIKIVEGKSPGTIRVEGKYQSATYCPPAGGASAPDEARIRGYFRELMKKQGGTFVGTTDDYGDKKDVYTLTKKGREYWIEVWPENIGGGMYTYGVTLKGAR
jgi:hypothetical protein